MDWKRRYFFSDRRLGYAAVTPELEDLFFRHGVQWNPDALPANRG